MHEWKLVHTLYMTVALVSSVSVRTCMNWIVFFSSTYIKTVTCSRQVIMYNRGWGGIIIANTASRCAWLLLVLSVGTRAKAKNVLCLFSVKQERTIWPRLYSLQYSPTLVLHPVHPSAQILLSLFSAITNARTAALPGCSAGAKLRLLRLMMAGTMNVG